MAESQVKLIRIKTRRYSELLRRILMTYRGVDVLVERKPHGDVDALLNNWCTNAKIRKTHDLEVLRDGKSLFGFHDGPDGFFWAASSEKPFVEQLSSERIVRYRVFSDGAPRLPHWVAWLMVAVVLMLILAVLWVAGIRGWVRLPYIALMFGSHLSIAGGLHNALLEAEKLGLDTVQIFTKNQQQWRVPPLEQPAIDQWSAHCQRLGFSQTVSHDSYLINLASPVEALWRKSIDLFTEEFARCSALKIPYLVTHPGAHMGTGEEVGLKRVAAALDEVFARWPNGGVITCLEITAGQGSSLGYKLEHLAELIALVHSPQRLGVCLDTAHLFAAGYDFRGSKYAAFMRQVEATIGRERIMVLHLNDSKKDLGSRVDRHEHIGKGFIGLEGFTPFVRDKQFKTVPKILETPKEKSPDGRQWDEVNLETLRGLM